MTFYNTPDLQKAGYLFTGFVLLRVAIPGYHHECKHAEALDVRLQDLRYFRVAVECWALFLDPAYQVGYKETALLP